MATNEWSIQRAKQELLNIHPVLAFLIAAENLFVFIANDDHTHRRMC